MSELVRLSDVTKVYGTVVRTEAVKGVSLLLERGELTALVGDSGSGKSTLLNIIGLLDRPTSGEMYLEGRQVQSLGRKQRAGLRNQFVGFVFQYHYLLPEFTVLENVIMPGRIEGRQSVTKLKTRAREVLTVLGLAELANKNAAQLSGGEKQRAAIARALMNQPALVLADEPTGNLDTANSDQVYALFRQINRDLGTTFLVVTHNLAIARRATRIIEVSDGRITRDERNRRQAS